MCCNMTLAILFSFTQSLPAQQEYPAATDYVPLVDRGLEMELWAREPLLINPVALSFDDQGRLFVVETARRGSVDIDIRAHKEWIKEDLGSDSIPQQIELFKSWMAPEKSGENRQWLPDLNNDGSHDWRDLTMVKERIHRIEDTDGDGKADTSKVFAEGFNEPNNGAAAGVLPYGNDVYYTIYPDIWRLTDKDQDGIADSREILHRGFGVHAAMDGHDIHGLTVGPDGWIYFSVGDNGISVTTKEGNKIHHPNTGGVLRMRPDGSDLELFAYGLRNVQEIAFDDFGNWFSVDNDGDVRGERERFVYITEGSDSGWRLNWQFRTKGWATYTGMPTYSPWIEEKMWIPHHEGQAAYITPPIANYSVGPGGFKYNPGTALNDRYKGFFFLAQFPVKKITAFRAKPKGAYFEMVDEHIFHQGLMASAINFGPDGGTYIADWDGMWMPNDKGAIYKVDNPNVASSLIRQEVKRLISMSFKAQAISDLLTWLGHADQRIRLKAQFELVRRERLNELLAMARNAEAPLLARIHALWGIGQFEDRVPASVLSLLPFKAPSPEVRAQSAKIAGDLKATPLSNQLISLLKDDHPRVRFMAGIALGKTGDRSGFEAARQMLRENNGEDPYLRHAGVMAWVGMNDVASLEACSSDASLPVRVAAVVALRRLQSEAVKAFLKDDHINVVQEAARAIHDDFSIPGALHDLARLLMNLPETMHSDEAIVRRAINANMRLGRQENAARLLAYARDHTAPETMRIEALESLATWNAHPYLDRVTGRVRHLVNRETDAADNVLKSGFQSVLNEATPTLRSELIRLVDTYQIKVNDATLAAWVLSPDFDLTTRIGSLSALTESAYIGLTDVINQTLQSDQAPLRHQALDSLAKTNAEQFTNYFRDKGRSLTLKEQQLGLKQLGTIHNETSRSILKKYFDRLKEGNLDSKLHLDVLEAVSAQKGSDLAEKATQYRQNLGSPMRLTYHQSALAGGDIERGRQVFEGHIAAQCIRCHDAGGPENQVGPVLKGIGKTKTREYLLESLIHPSAKLAEGYALTMIQLKDGTTHSGRIASEKDETLTFINVAGEKLELATPDIEQRTVIQASTMPPMIGILTPFELRDLVEFLATWE
jgi:quinoprotein glucose dehydrogenase